MCRQGTDGKGWFMTVNGVSDNLNYTSYDSQHFFKSPIVISSGKIRGKKFCFRHVCKDGRSGAFELKAQVHM